MCTEVKNLKGSFDESYIEKLTICDEEWLET